MILISTHAVFLDGKDIYGPPHAISIFLNRKKISHVFIKHDLYGKQPSLIEHYERGKLIETKTREIRAQQAIVRYLKEAWCNLQVAKSYSPLQIYIGVDPLNGCIGPFLCMFSLSKASIYFCADFAIQRFDSGVMNTIYHLLDSFCMFFTTLTFSISSRVVEYRRKKGLSDAKNKRVPNAPFFDSIERTSDDKINRFDFVIVSALEKGIDFMTLLDAFSIVSSQFKQSRLHVIGSGSLEKRMRQKVEKLSLKRSVFFHGALSHDEMFKKMVNYGVGIALYSDADPNHFRYFSDPMKVRDYLASGLPVLVSGNSAITQEIEEENVGFAVSLNTDDLAKKMKELVSDEKKYLLYRKSALKLAKKYDTNQLLKQYLSPFFV